MSGRTYASFLELEEFLVELGAGDQLDRIDCESLVHFAQKETQDRQPCIRMEACV
jgi:hypothetical protein